MNRMVPWFKVATSSASRRVFSSSARACEGDSPLVQRAKEQSIPPASFQWTFRDSILYNLSVGAQADELSLIYEGSKDFHVLPTYGALIQFTHSFAVPMDWLPNYQYLKVLHGEQYLKLRKPLPPSGNVTNQTKLLEVLSKGKAASLTFGVETRDESGELLLEGSSTIFARDVGKIEAPKKGIDRGFATAAHQPPNRSPDAIVEYKTDPRQAALYRTGGDYNPLHVDPASAASVELPPRSNSTDSESSHSVGQFDKPILHGLCFFGIAGKAIFSTYGPFSEFKVRFSGVIYPGETVVTEMWKEDDLVFFVAKCRERDTIILSHAAARLGL